MERKRKDSAAGGLGLLAAAAYLCYRGLKHVDAKLKKAAEKKSQKP